MIQIVLLDDEKHCTDVLQSLISNVSDQYDIIGIFNEPYKALDFIQNNSFDLLFLDVQMPELNGFALLDKILPSSFDIIFTTAFDNYAVKAFDYSAVHYLLKPITERSIVNALSAWEHRRNATRDEQWDLLRGAVAHPETDIAKIALPTGTGFEIIELKDIVRCQSESNYTSFVMSDGKKILVCRTLKDVEGLLSDQPFFRVHQSHLIHAKYVRSISRQEGGVIYMADGEKIPVSRQRKENVNSLLDSMIRFD